jgi:hypothetical protein
MGLISPSSQVASVVFTIRGYVLLGAQAPLLNAKKTGNSARVQSIPACMNPSWRAWRPSAHAAGLPRRFAPRHDEEASLRASLLMKPFCVLAGLLRRYALRHDEAASLRASFLMKPFCVLAGLPRRFAPRNDEEAGLRASLLMKPFCVLAGLPRCFAPRHDEEAGRRHAAALYPAFRAPKSTTNTSKKGYILGFSHSDERRP